MREAFDCAVLMVPAHNDWMRQWMDNGACRIRRFHFHAYPFDKAPAGFNASHAAGPDVDAGATALQRAAPALRRFDLCLLPITQATLGWTRTALACVQGSLDVPILGLLDDVKAPAVSDLFALGMKDFLRSPPCEEEFRARALRLALAGMPREAAPGPADTDASSAGASEDPAHAHRLGERTLHYGTEPCARIRPQSALMERAMLELVAAPQVHAGEAFRSAKSRIVDSFERDYLRLALQRHHGNVARAARASSKHRRAFWALMRKHGIDASPFRRAASERCRASDALAPD